MQNYLVGKQPHTYTPHQQSTQQMQQYAQTTFQQLIAPIPPVVQPIFPKTPYAS